MLDDHLGPTDYVVVEFTDATTLRRGFDRLLRLVDDGLIRVLDLEFVTKDATGTTQVLAVTELGADLAEFEGAFSGLLDSADLATVGDQLAPLASAAVLVYEELALIGVIKDWEDAGARIVSEGPVDVDDLDAALEGN